MKIRFQVLGLFLSIWAVLSTISCGQLDSSKIGGLRPDSLGVQKEREFHETDEITDAINKFWKFSLEDDQVGLVKYVREVPASFWRINSDAEDGSIIPDFSPDDRRPSGSGIGTTASDAERTSWLLENFSQQIHRARPELLKVRVIRSNEKEAVVKIDWAPAKDHEGGGWISKYLLLYRGDENWQVFMVTDPLELEKFNNHFGT